MRPAPSVQAFLSDPYGRYFCGRRHLMFAPSRTLIGYVCWGYPDVDDVRQLLALCEIGLARDAEPHRFLVDLRGLEFVEPRTFTMFLDYTRRNRELLKKKLTQQAILRPEGMVGAIISGFSHVARLPYPERVFDDVEQALHWLQIAQDEGVALMAELDGIRAAASGTHETVRRVRELLDHAPSATLRELAGQLGLSTRSCQRALRDAGTSFREELRATRVRRAKEFLSASERNLTWIAAELGYSSVQHFATAFRRATGETPSAWRARHKPEGGERATKPA